MTRSTMFLVLVDLAVMSACFAGEDGVLDRNGNGHGRWKDAAIDPLDPDSGSSGSGSDGGTGTAPTNDVPAPLRTITVDTVEELRAALTASQPGDLINLRDKIWQFTSYVDIPRSGTAEHPIVISSETIGGVTITGSAGFDLSAVSHVVVRGFDFRFTAGSIGIDCDACSYVRFTRNHFELAGTEYSHWLRLSGTSHHNRVDRNVFINKSTMGNMLTFHGTSTAVASNNLIELNHFANHSYPGNENGECMRIGWSALKYSKGYNVIERNLFERCNGDPEIISTKSSNNSIRFNTFRDNNGALVFRHGHQSEAVGNFFFGNDGGVRLYGDDHRIVGNYFEANHGSGARTTIVIGSGDALDDSITSTGNDAPERVLVAFNTLVNNSSHIAIGSRSTDAYGATDCTIANNLLVGDASTFATKIRTYSAFTWSGNMLSGSAATGEFPASGHTRTSSPKLVSSGGIMHLVSDSPARDAATGSYPEITDDIDGVARSGVYDIGADEYSTAPAARLPLQAVDVGPGAP